jgi:hypothetical protein
MKRAKKRPLPGPAKGASNRERRILRDYSQRRAGKAETMVALGFTDVHELYFRLADYGLRLPRVSDERAREMVEGLERFLAEHGNRPVRARTNPCRADNDKHPS